MGLPVGVYNPFEASLKDKGGEVGTFRCLGLVTDTDGGNYEDNNTAAAAFVAAINGATLGVLVRWQYQNEHVVDPVSKAASASAQRENKILIRYHELMTLRPMTATLPTVDLPNLVFETDAKDFVSLTSPAFMPALTAAWAAFVTGQAGNLTVIDSAEFVGRNT